jgi:hypothetical protein
MMLACVNNSSIYAQNVVREGKVFKSQGRSTHKADTLVTEYKFEANGVQHPIIINRSTGSCYIWKKSKNNKMYKQYMKSEVSQQAAKEYNIEYKPRNRR